MSITSLTATFGSPASFSLAASANDNDGSIAKVDFFSGATLFATALTTPYSIPLNNVAAGSYLFTARATDNGGASTTSSAVRITVNSGPPPANDDFPNAQVIAGSSGTVTGDNLNASVEPGSRFMRRISEVTPSGTGGPQPPAIKRCSTPSEAISTLCWRCTWEAASVCSTSWAVTMISIRAHRQAA